MSGRAYTGEDGFTLMEVLAALVILSVSIFGLVSATTNATRTVSTLETRTLASIVADNQVAAVRVRDDLRGERFSQNGTSEQMGQSFDWRVEVTPTELDTLREVVATVEIDGRVVVTRRSYLAVTPPQPAVPADSTF